MLLINLKLRRETCKFSPNNSTHILNSHVCSFPSTVFYTAVWNFGRELPDAAKIMREEMDLNLADSSLQGARDHAFLSVQ